MAEEAPIVLGEAGAAGPKAFKTVAELVESALPPMLTLINHLKTTSPFINAIGNLGAEKDKITLDDSIQNFRLAIEKFQGELGRYGIKASDLSQIKGGTRKHQAKRRASTRGSYRRQRY